MNRYLPKPGSLTGGIRHRLRQAGYSLYDLIITSAVASLLGVSAIGMTGTVQDARMTAAVNQLMGDLSLARSEAIKRNVTVILCKSNNSTSCSDEAAWHDGWIVFVDDNNNHDVDTGEAIIHVQQGLEKNLTLRYGSLHDYLRYSPLSETWTGTFTFCDARGPEKAKAVIVFWTGRPRVSTKTSDGKPLRCS